MTYCETLPFFLVIFAKLSAPTSDVSPVGPPSDALMDMTMGCYDN